MDSYVPTELQAYGDLINPPSKSSTPTGDLVGIYQGLPIYSNKPIDAVYTGSDQDGNAYFIDKNTGAPIHSDDDGSYHFNGDGGDDSVDGSQNLSGFDPSKLLSSATLGKVDWNYQSVQGGMGASGNNGVAINALWGGSYYPNGRVTNWSDIDPTQKQANFTAGQTRDALWNVYDNLSAQGKTPAKNPDEIALQLAADNGATNYNSAGYIAGYGAGANTLGLAQTISAVFMNQPQVVSVTQHPYTVSPQSIADATAFGEAHSSPNVINTLNTFVKQGQNGPDYLGAALQAGALAMAGGAFYSGALGGLGGATVGTSTVAATTAGIANTTLAAVGAGAAVGGISAAINGGSIVEGALKGAFASALGAVISPAAQELVKASNGAINLQVAQAAVQAAAVAAKAGLTGGDVTKAITNSLEGSAISAGMKDMNIPSNIAKIVTPIVVTGLNNGDVNAAIQNSLINYASDFAKSAISPSTTPSTPPAVTSPVPDVGQPIATPLAEPTGGLPTNVPVVTAPEQPIVTQPVEPTSGLSAIPDTGQPVATPIADTSGGLPTTAPVAELTPEQLNRLHNTLAGGDATSDAGPITMSGLGTLNPGKLNIEIVGNENTPTTADNGGGNSTDSNVISTENSNATTKESFTPEENNAISNFSPEQQKVFNDLLKDPNISLKDAVAIASDLVSSGSSSSSGTTAGGGLPAPEYNPLLDVPLLPVNPASVTGGLPTNDSPTPPSNGSGSTNEPPSPNPPVNGSPTAPPVENAPPPPNGLPVENTPSKETPSSDNPTPNTPTGDVVPISNPSTGGLSTAPVDDKLDPTKTTPTTNQSNVDLSNQLAILDASTLAKFEQMNSEQKSAVIAQAGINGDLTKSIDNVQKGVDAQGNQIESIQSGLTTLGDTVNANQNTTNTAIGDLSESTKVALANATAQEKSDFENLNASQQASTIAATEQGVALSKAIEASQSKTESQIGNLSDTVASNQAQTNASLANLSNEQKANFDAMTKAQQDAAIAQAGVNGSLSKSISNVQNGLDAQGNQIAGLTSTVSGLGTTVNGLGTQVGDLSSTVGGLGATVSGLGTALDNLSTADKANFATLSDAQKQLAVDEAKATGDLSKAIADVASSTTSGLASIASSVSGLGNTVSANQAATTASQQSLANQLLALQNQQKNNQLLTASQIIQPTEIMNKKQQYSGLYGGLPDATIKTPTETPFSYAPTKEAQLEDYTPISQEFYHGGPVHYADGSGDEPVELSADAEQMKKLTDMVNAYVNKPSRKEEPIIHHNESMMEMHPLLRASMISAHERSDPMYRGMPADMYTVHNTAHPFSGEMRKMAKLHDYSPIMRTHNISGIHGYEDSENMSHGGQIDPKLLAILQKHFVPGPEGHLYQRHEERGFAVGGAGTGQSDDIPTMLSDGEYVVDADTVAALGDGSSKAGAEALDKMREAIRTHKRSAPADKIPPKAKSPLEYLKMSKGR